MWPPADASFDFVTWLELELTFGRGLNRPRDDECSVAVIRSLFSERFPMYNSSVLLSAGLSFGSFSLYCFVNQCYRIVRVV